MPTDELPLSVVSTGRDRNPRLLGGDSHNLSADLFQSLCQPNLDNGLARNAQTLCLPIQRIQHPDRDFHVNMLLLLGGTASLGKVKFFDDAIAIIEFFIEIRYF
jgi:hypothetical protein